MKYFIDTEFLEGTQTKRVLGFNVGQTKPTVDLISIGIVSEDGREYYAISKEFNLKEAWNRFQWKVEDIHPAKFRQKGMSATYGNMAYPKKEYWIRENVLKPIFLELALRNDFEYVGREMTYSLLKKLINKYGKTNSQIAKEVKEFVYKPYHISNSIINNHKDFERALFVNPISFYGYYADYDWVVFCWLFGKMIDLPQGFPMYCNDLKQILETRGFACNGTTIPLEMWGKDITEHPNYPAQKDEHNALADARWNKKLYEFLKSL
jgi:hypothetical protein